MATTRKDKASTRKPAETTVCPLCGTAGINKMGLGRHKNSETCKRAARLRDGTAQGSQSRAPHVTHDLADPAYAELLNTFVDSSKSNIINSMAFH